MDTWVITVELQLKLPPVIPAFHVGAGLNPDHSTFDPVPC